MTAQEAFFKTHLPSALTRHFERQNPVRFTVGPLNIKRVPNRQHPRGWDMLRIRIPITDHEHSSTRGLPPVELEIAAPEKLGPDSTEIRDFLGTPACVYTLHRIAGEKLRAYLTSLPAYRDKMGAPRDMRVKDLYDLTRILQHQPITQTEFWKKALAEFLLACESRYVDCEGPTTFRQEWALAKQLYEQDLHLQKIPFNEVETALNTLLNFLEQQGIFPLQFPLPPETETSQSPLIK